MSKESEHYYLPRPNFKILFAECVYMKSRNYPLVLLPVFIFSVVQIFSTYSYFQAEFFISPVSRRKKWDFALCGIFLPFFPFSFATTVCMMWWTQSFDCILTAKNVLVIWCCQLCLGSLGFYGSSNKTWTAVQCYMLQLLLLFSDKTAMLVVLLLELDALLLLFHWFKHSI